MFDYTTLMNINTGSVDTYDNWKAEWETAIKNDCTVLSWEDWSRDLVEVIKDDTGNWVEF